MKLNPLVLEWLVVFGKNVNQNILDRRVCVSGGYFLWHIFTWGCVEAIEGISATKAYEGVKDIEVIYFTDGIDNSIVNVEIRKKPSLKEIEESTYGDIYITAKDYSWTYVKTHEVGIGAYFVRKDAKINKDFEKKILKSLGYL